MDQSGSMATSLIYGGVMGAILASIPAVETHVVAFNHQDVVDPDQAWCADPVDLLFGMQLGGAEDYYLATCYCEKLMHTPRQTLYILLADLYDTSPNEAKFVKKMAELLAGGVKAVGLLAISDQGQPSFNESLARKLAALGMPCFGCTPDQLPDLLAAVLKGQDLAASAVSFSETETRAIARRFSGTEYSPDRAGTAVPRRWSAPYGSRPAPSRVPSPDSFPAWPAPAPGRRAWS